MEPETDKFNPPVGGGFAADFRRFFGGFLMPDFGSYNALDVYSVFRFFLGLPA